MIEEGKEMDHRTIKMMNLQSIQFDFLWYSYFGMRRLDSNATDEQKEAALIACIHRAYRDANRKMPYALSESGMRKEENKDIVKVHKKLKAQFSPAAATKKEPESVEIIIKHIRALLSESNEGYSESSFDKWHKSTCTCVKEYAEEQVENDVSLFENNTFPYGLAQKWINMTLKYMLIMGLWNEELNRKAQYFHAPIDSYIISKVKENWESQLKEFWTDRSWYELDDSDEYFKFQKLIRQNLNLQQKSPIEWEAYAWLEQATSKDCKKDSLND